MTDIEVINRMLHHQVSELAQASKWRLISLSCQFLLSIVTAISVFFGDNKLLLILAIVGGALTASWLFCDQLYRKHRAAGDQARRIVLIGHGLGDPVSDPSTITEAFDAKLTASCSTVDQYFASKAPPGYQRISEMIDESAFFTGSLQRSSALVMAIAATGILISSTILFLICGAYFGTDVFTTAVRVIIAFLIFVMSSDVMGCALGHQSAGAEIGRIRLRLVAAKAAKYPSSDILLLLADYNAIVEAAPLPLPYLYDKLGDHLNARWAEYKVETGLG